MEKVDDVLREATIVTIPHTIVRREGEREKENVSLALSSRHPLMDDRKQLLLVV